MGQQCRNGTTSNRAASCVLVLLQAWCREFRMDQLDFVRKTSLRDRSKVSKLGLSIGFFEGYRVNIQTRHGCYGCSMVSSPQIHAFWFKITHSELNNFKIVRQHIFENFLKSSDFEKMLHFRLERKHGTPSSLICPKSLPVPGGWNGRGAENLEVEKTVRNLDGFDRFPQVVSRHL